MSCTTVNGVTAGDVNGEHLSIDRLRLHGCDVASYHHDGLFPR